LKDRVTQAVDLDEHELSSNERTQALSENMQSMEEQEIVEHEETNRKEGRRKLTESLNQGSA
jgi:hypothetical protein